LAYKHKLLRKLKVFVIPSSDIFWANGTAISNSGREILSTISEFLKGTAVRVVIGETNLNKEEGPGDFGLSRACAVLDYLVSQQGLDRNRFNISAASTINKIQLTSMENEASLKVNNRILEIILLEWSIYN
jgi:hypothetical protein